MILTQGEKMVWAVAFVSERDLVMAQAHGGDGEIKTISLREAERLGDKAIRNGIEAASQAVEELRKKAQETEEDYGEDSDVAQMLRAMLGDDG